MTTRGRPPVGVMLPASATTGTVDVAHVLEVARHAEALGFDGVYVGDHLLHPREQLESLTTLAAVAAVTDRVTVGTCVMLLALRDPLVTAKQLATLAALAPGRLRVGVGVGGEYPEEFEVAGVPLAERGRRLGAAVRTVRDVLTNGFTRGELSLARTAPEVGFLFGGWSDPALRRAAELGDGWVGYLLRPPGFAKRRDALAERRDALRDGLAVRRGERFTTGMQLPVRVGADGLGEYWGRVTGKPPFPDDLFATGAPEQVVARLHEYVERGCDEFVLAVGAEGRELLDQLDLLATHVLPHL